MQLAAAITTIASMLQTLQPLRLYSKVAGTGVVPLQWQSAVLTPIYKQKGDVNDLGNYLFIYYYICPAKKPV